MKSRLDERRTPLDNDVDPDGMDSDTEGDELEAGHDDDSDAGDLADGPDGAVDRRKSGQGRTSGTTARHARTPPRAEAAADSNRHRSGLLARLGPGLITGASDDDPSGIATYSQAGSLFGFGLLWTLLFSYPLMGGMQEISARIGVVTGRGLAGNLRRHFPRPAAVCRRRRFCSWPTRSTSARTSARWRRRSGCLSADNPSVHHRRSAPAARALEVFVPYHQLRLDS